MFDHYFEDPRSVAKIYENPAIFISTVISDLRKDQPDIDTVLAHILSHRQMRQVFRALIDDIAIQEIRYGPESW